MTSEEKRRRAVELRAAGRNYREIGEVLGLSRQRAHQMQGEP